MNPNTMAVLYSALLFLVIAVGGLNLLPRARSTGARIGMFLLFVIVCVAATLLATKRWQLLMGGAAIAWIIALVLAGLAMLVTRARKKREISAL